MRASPRCACRTCAKSTKRTRHAPCSRREMTCEELFESARNAALQIRRIEEQAQALSEGIGVQGHKYERVNVTGTLDWTAKVDDLLQWETNAKERIAECHRELGIAWELVAGMERLGWDVTLATERYLRGKPWDEVVGKNQIASAQARCRAMFANVDQIGIAKVREVGRG